MLDGYEIDGADQSGFDAYLDSDGGPAARRKLLAAELWRPPDKDGTSSGSPPAVSRAPGSAPGGP